MRYETWTGWGRLAVIGLLALVMAACGGNGGTTPMTGGDTTPPPVDTDALNAAKAAAMAAYDMAKKAVADVEAHKDADMDSYNMAVTKRDEAMAANTKAQAAETVADAENYQKMAEDANAAAMKYAGMVTTAAGTAADRAMAAAIAPAIADPDGNEKIAGDAETGLMKAERPGGSATPGASVTFTVVPGGAVTVDLDGTTGSDETMRDTLDKDDMTGDPPMSIENQFMKQADAMRADLDGFAVSVHERTMDKVTDTLTVYTNVEDPTDRAYNTYFSTENLGAETHSASEAVSTVVEETGVLTVDKDDIKGNHMLFSGSWLPTGNNEYAQLPGADDEETDTKENEFMGMFRGVAGTFICTGTGGCRVENDEDGNLTNITGDGVLTFTPTVARDSSLDKIMVEGVAPDGDFLTFGYWLQAKEQDDESTKYGINTFYTGAQPFTGEASSSTDTATNTQVHGTAEYSGKATGMYARKTFDTKGVGTPTSSGQFTADANLMAYFGVDDNVAKIKHNTISGTVSNFKDDSGSMIDDAWMVELNKAEITYNNDAAIGATIGLTSTTGGGEWQGAFYGNPMNADGPIENDLDTPAAENAPTSVAGEFNAHFSNGHVIGAFGATKK